MKLPGYRLNSCTVDYLLGRQDVDDSKLSAFEMSLIIAARNADERAREDALNLLIAHSESCQKESPA